MILVRMPPGSSKNSVIFNKDLSCWNVLDRKAGDTPIIVGIVEEAVFYEAQSLVIERLSWKIVVGPQDRLGFERELQVWQTCNQDLQSGLQ